MSREAPMVTVTVDGRGAVAAGTLRRKFERRRDVDSPLAHHSSLYRATAVTGHVRAVA